MIPSLMILTGYALILSLAYYWMRRAVKAEDRVVELEVRNLDTVKFYKVGDDAFARQLGDYISRLDRIIAQDTPNSNATVKRIIRIARGE